MTTQRAYLVSKGLAKGTRGRFSADAKAELARVRVEGMTFDDDAAPVVPKPIVTDEKESIPEKPKRNDHDKFPVHISRITTQETFEFEKPVGVVSSTEACANCGYSLAYANCGNTQVRDWRTDRLCNLV